MDDPLDAYMVGMPTVHVTRIHVEAASGEDATFLAAARVHRDRRRRDPTASLIRNRRYARMLQV